MENNQPSKTEYLKAIWREVRSLISKNEFDAAIQKTEYLIAENIDDVNALRMLLDAIMPVSNEELFIPLKDKLIKLIEDKIGKNIH